MKVGDLMRRNPLTAGPDTAVGEVAKIMTETGSGEVIIVEGQHVVGVVTAADLIAKHAKLHFPTYFSLLGYSIPIETRKDEREVKKALATTAGDLMSEAAASIDPDSDIDEAATVMLDRGLRFLPVLKDGRLVGVIDELHIVRLLVVEEAG